jgi:hypothetical protein
LAAGSSLAGGFVTSLLDEERRGASDAAVVVVSSVALEFFEDLAAGSSLAGGFVTSLLDEERRGASDAAVVVVSSVALEFFEDFEVFCSTSTPSRVVGATVVGLSTVVGAAVREGAVSFFAASLGTEEVRFVGFGGIRPYCYICINCYRRYGGSKGWRVSVEKMHCSMHETKTAK